MATLLPQPLYEDFFVCKLCSGEYREAKTLPCLHSFCTPCLESYVRKHTTESAHLWFMCPECRDIINIPATGISGYHTNDFLMNLKQITWNRARSGLQEDYDQQKGPLNELDSQTNETLFTLLRQQRGLHGCTCTLLPGEERELYCNVCTSLICRACLEDHRLHSVITLNERAHVDRDLLMTLLHQCRKDISVINDSLTGLERHKRLVKKSRDEAIAKLKQRSNRLHEIVNELELKNTTAINEMYDKERSKSDNVLSTNGNVSHILKKLTQFVERTLEGGSSTALVVWRAHLQLQAKKILMESRQLEADAITRTRVEIRYIKETEDKDLVDILSRCTGRLEFGHNIDLYDNAHSTSTGGANGNPGTVAQTDSSSPEVGMFKNRVYHGKLVRSFSTHSENSSSPPCLLSVTMGPDDGLIVTDSNNKCVRFYNIEGAMYRKIHTSDALWGVCCLSPNALSNLGDDVQCTFAVTDRTVHVFDHRGRVLKVLRQHPRDSHGICEAIGTEGGLVVADCSARCVFILSRAGNIRKVLTQCGQKPFKRPQYVSVNKYPAAGPHMGDIIISDTELNSVAIFNENGRVVALYEGETGNDGGKKNWTLNRPTGVCCDRSGNIIVCDSGNNRVLMLNSGGNFVFELLNNDDVTRPQDVAINSQNELVVVEWSGMVRCYKYIELVTY